MAGSARGRSPRGLRSLLTAVSTAAAVAAIGLSAACTGLTDPSRDSTGPTTSSSSDAAASANAAVPTNLTTPTPTLDPSRDVQAAAAELTTRRVGALDTKDRASWLTTVADPAAPFGAAQGALFDAMVKLPLSHLTTRSVQVQTTTGTPPETSVGATWVIDLDLAYQFVGYDRREREYRVSYLMTRTPDGWRFSGTGPDPSDPQPFDLPDMNVASSPSTLVIGDVPAATLRDYVALGDTGRSRVQAVWGESVPAVLVLPKTADEMVAQIGGSKASLDQVAGVTTGPGGHGTTASSDRVYLNPEALVSLTQVGRQVIVTHELTHVTTRATTVEPPPLWLGEGFADYVGFKSAGLPVTAVAEAELDQVRDGHGPTALPGSVAFDPATSTIEPAYNQAWLAVSLMRRTYGEDKVVAFYRAVCGTPTAAPRNGATPDDLASGAFQSVLGTTQDAFVKDWVAYLQKLAR